MYIDRFNTQHFDRSLGKPVLFEAFQSQHRLNTPAIRKSARGLPIGEVPQPSRRHMPPYLGILRFATRRQCITNQPLKPGRKTTDATNKSESTGQYELGTFSSIKLVNDSIRNSLRLQTKVP